LNIFWEQHKNFLDFVFSGLIIKRKLLSLPELMNTNKDKKLRRYICERCGGTGQQEAGVWDWKTKTYTAPAGVCDMCHGEGLLGIMSGQDQEEVDDNDFLGS